MRKFRFDAIFAIMGYRPTALRNLGIAQMIVGAFMIVFGIASLFAVHHWSSSVGFGIWVGFWVFLTGVLGYIGARNDSFPNICLTGSFMGFSITGCVLVGTMFICYCISLAEFATRLRCSYYSSYYGCYYRNDLTRSAARNGAGLGSCLLIFTIVEFFIALASSIYCCNAVCCNAAPAGPQATQMQQVMFVPQQHMYQGGQPGMVCLQPSGQVTTIQAGYPAQPLMLAPQQQMQPAYWAAGPGGAAVPVSFAAAGTLQASGLTQQPQKNVELPPPYSDGMTPVARDAGQQAQGTF